MPVVLLLAWKAVVRMTANWGSFMEQDRPKVLDAVGIDLD